MSIKEEGEVAIDEEEEEKPSSVLKRQLSRSQEILITNRVVKKLKDVKVYCLVQLKYSTSECDEKSYLIKRDDIAQELLDILQECNGKSYSDLRDDSDPETLPLMEAIERIERALEDDHAESKVDFSDTRSLIELNCLENKIINEWFRIGL